MSIFSSLFGASENNNDSVSKMKWIALENLEQLNEIRLLSQKQPVLIFKHSTRCSVSRMALKQFENEFDFQEKATPYFLDLLAHREISNAIAEQFQVPHESPQLLLIREGMVVYTASHSGIDANTLKNLVTN
jgi:bacillithiol system protein YtxJ